MTQYADEIRRKRLVDETQIKLTACKLRIKELKKQVKTAKAEMGELESQIEQLTRRTHVRP